MNDTSKFDYLRGRPFLTVTILQRPAPGVHTERAGWMARATAITEDESPRVVRRISTTMLCTASVIIDIERGVAIKNRTKHSDAEVIARYRHLFVSQAA